jgi:hypothetical protein
MSLIAALLLGFVLPAAACGLLLADRPQPDHHDADVEPDAADRVDASWLVISRGLAGGLATWLLGSGVLARTVGLTTGSAWVWDAVVGAASVVVLLLPRHRTRLRAVLLPSGRRLAEIAGLTALVYLPVAVVVLRTPWSPFGSTPWFYYGLARQVADSGSIPRTSVEFAPHVFTTGTAMLLVQYHGGPVTVLTVITLLGVLLTGVGSVSLAAAFGAGRLVSLLTVPVVIGTGIGTVRLTAYRPEGFGLGLSLLLVALSIDWFRRRDRRSLLGAALLAATLSQVHGIAALCAGILVVAAAVSLAPRGSWRPYALWAATGLVLLLAAVLVTGLAFHEASGTGTAAGHLVDRGGIGDPTWEFYNAARARPPSLPPSNGSMLYRALHSAYGASFWWLLPLLLLAFVGLRRRWRDVQTRQVVRFVLLALLGLALAASVFMFVWQGFVPRRTGASRIALEASLLLPPLLAVGLGDLGRETWTWRRRGRLRTLRRPVLAMLGVLVAGSLVSMTGVAVATSGTTLDRQQLAVWESLPLRDDDVVLANGYTEGFIPDVTPAEGLLDGRAPYTFGGLLHHANGLFRGAEDFFAHPSQHWDYLARHHVTWIVVAKPGSYALSTYNVWSVPRHPEALARCSGLHKYVAAWGLTVYRVVDPGPGGCRPRPVRG